MDITMTLIEDGFFGARYYELRIKAREVDDKHTLRVGYSGLWTFDTNPIDMRYDTFSGMMEDLANLYPDFIAEPIRQWAYDMEDQDEDDMWEEMA